MHNVNYDIDDQQPGNYVYDRIGNLIRDVSEGIAAIEWTSTGKVAKITRVTGSDKPDLEFWYDASGQRVAKIVKPRPAGQPSVRKAWTITWYVRDASGNVLSTYEERIDDDAECPDCNLTGDCLQIIWSEAHIYGAERLGMQKQNIAVAHAKVFYQGNNLQYILDCPFFATPHLQHLVGMKHYEQKDHLGNCASPYASPKRSIRDSHPVRNDTGVIVVHTDKRIAVTNSQGQVLSYRAEVVTKQYGKFPRPKWQYYKVEPPIGEGGIFDLLGYDYWSFD